MIVVPQIAVTDEAGDAPSRVSQVAADWVRQGATALQLRTLDGQALADPGTRESVSRLVDALRVPVQFDAAPDAGAVEAAAAIAFATVVVGAAAIHDPILLRWALDMLGDRTVVEVPADGVYLYDPPPGGYALEVVEAVRRLRVQGVSRVLLRDITGLALPLNLLRSLCVDLDVRVTFHGLVRSVGDLRELSVVGSRNLEAVVVGEPLYDGRMRLADAIAAAQGR